MKIYLKDVNKTIILDDKTVKAYHEFLNNEELFKEGAAENTVYSMIQAWCHKDPRETVRKMPEKQVAEIIEETIKQEITDIAGADAWRKLYNG